MYGSPHKEHGYIRLKFAENGGCILEWTTWDPGSNMEYSEDEHTKIFGEDQKEELMETISTLYKENMDWMEDYAKGKDPKSLYSNPGYHSKPQKGMG